ncbi:hypothetical protein ACFE04_028276 [Oxalis oulophora]
MTSNTGRKSGIFPEFQIKIVNNFTNEEQVSVHCYSGSDDRGSQTLTRFGQVYDFIYKPKFFESKEFTCVLLHATPDGIYLTDTYNNKDWLMYKWEKEGLENVVMAPLRELTSAQIWKIQLEEIIEGFFPETYGCN